MEIRFKYALSFALLLTAAWMQTYAALGESVIANGVALAASGKLVVAGASSVEAAGGNISTSTLFVARYDSSGTLDTSFDSDGVVSTVIGSSSRGAAVAVQSGDDKIVVAGTADNQVVVVRYNTNGSLDTTFDTDGIVQTTVGAGCEVRAVAIDSSGNIVVGGLVVVDGLINILLVRYTSAGALDTTFNTDGIVTEKLNFGTTAYALAIDGSDNIIVAGYDMSTQTDIMLAKFDSSGSLVTSFGSDSNGYVRTPVGTFPMARGIVLDGTSIYVTGDSDSRLVVLKYTSAGVLDTGFDTDGILVDAIGTHSRGVAIDVQSDNKVVVAGTSGGKSVVARYSTAGVREDLFSSYQGSSTGLLVQSDDKSVIVGTTVFNTLLARFTTGGLADTAFGQDGLQQEPAGTNSLVGTPTYIYDEQSSGTDGGTFTAAAWQTRTLNKIYGDVGRVTISSNQFTLEPGRYRIQVTAPAFTVDAHKARLYNVTDSEVVSYGTSACAVNDLTHSIVNVTVSLDSAKTFKVEQYAQTTRAADGFGIAANITGVAERYTVVTVEYLGN